MKNNISRETSGKQIPVSSKTEFTGEVEYPVHISELTPDTASIEITHPAQHPEVELLIVQQGCAVFSLEHEKFTLHEGEGCFVNQNVLHSLSLPSAGSTCLIRSVMFHPSFLFGYGDSVFTGKYIVPLLTEPSLRVLCLKPADTLQKEILELAGHIFTLNTDKTFGYEIATKADLCNLWLLLLEYHTPLVNEIRQISTINPHELRTKEIIRYIEAHYAEKITLDDLASHVHISKSECCRCIKRCLNMTPVEYLMKYRIFRAASMIQCNDPMADSFSNLAFSVGFNNVSYFNKVFRQYLNCTPGEYRKRLKQDASFYPFNSGTFY